ncbi:hypothetical protein GLX30_30360 [Streptomyces sp. Tu 2975]|uniref:DUF6197 family protein n=1 Tax=Streptomyces sp. Tu 2975 TaxID=2676871 RepID=UPI0013579D99|nr:hypothetical protein [Streptomyces sp. Tu 2975]QIP87618.1 hypothetical protein GLX30_30360 [Streptomyces sp. Tu 2975]
MTTTLTPARVEVTVDLDTRLAIADAAMTLRLEQAQLQFDVNTAHLPEPVVDFVTPILPVVEPAPAVSPLADVLHRARTILQERGWTRGGLRDEQGAVCAVGAIRAAAHNRGQADEACAVLLDAIQREFASAETVPSWNDQQTSATPVIRILGIAAERMMDA